jgi:hypothetical protein
VQALVHRVLAAATSSAGGSKSGKPWERLIAFASIAQSLTVEKIEVPNSRSELRNTSDTTRSCHPGFAGARTGQNRKVDELEAAGEGGPAQLQLQRALLPTRLPGIEGLPLAARYLPAGAPDQIGGDWYDVIPMDGGVALVVGDVAGPTWRRPRSPRSCAARCGRTHSKATRRPRS